MWTRLRHQRQLIWPVNSAYALADAVYAAVARMRGGALVTLDREVEQRCAGHVPCLLPQAWGQS